MASLQNPIAFRGKEGFLRSDWDIRRWFLTGLFSSAEDIFTHFVPYLNSTMIAVLMWDRTARWLPRCHWRRRAEGISGTWGDRYKSRD